MTGPWVVAVRAALPSPRPQGWQAFQQAVGLAEAGLPAVTLVGDAGLEQGVPESLDEWLGRSLPANLDVQRPARRHRPPVAGLLFRRALARLRGPEATLLCRDARVAASEAGRWRKVLLEWHVRPDRAQRGVAEALKGADLHIVVSAGLAEDLLSEGVSEDRILHAPNACGLSPERARARAGGEGVVVALGLHRRGGLDLALEAWSRCPDLPTLLLAGDDQGRDRVAGWERRIESDPDLRGRVRLVGPHWGAAREALLDRASVWLALYPRDDVTETRLCPLQVADAAGSGLPLVTTDLPSIRALLGAAPAHFVPAGDPGALARQVLDALVQGPPAAAPRPDWAERARRLLAAT